VGEVERRMTKIEKRIEEVGRAVETGVNTYFIRLMEESPAEKDPLRPCHTVSSPRSTQVEEKLPIVLAQDIKIVQPQPLVA
jgi:hypothetical protein